MTNRELEAIKLNIIDTCRQLEKLGYFIGTWGNVSIRVPGGMIITPSRISYDVLVPGDFVTVGEDGTIVEGHRRPSSEADTHRAVYRVKPEVGAIVHSHSPYASAVSCMHRSIPPIVEEISQIIGGEIKCTKYVPAGRHQQLAAAVAKTIGEVQAVLVANHGVVCCGRDLPEALVASQIVEKAAQMMLAASPGGKLHRIPQKLVQEERHRYLYKYGTPHD